jgi:hypothetical protein
MTILVDKSATAFHLISSESNEYQEDLVNGISYYIYDDPNPNVNISFVDSGGHPVADLPMILCPVLLDHFPGYSLCGGYITDKNGFVHGQRALGWSTSKGWVIYFNNPGERLTAPFRYRSNEFGGEEVSGRIVLPEILAEGENTPIEILSP